jgi:dienelactone hydrolase
VRPDRRGALLAASLLAAALAPGCGGATPTDATACEPGSAWDGSACAAFAARVELRVPTPWSENGTPVTLEMIGYAPLGAPGPHPTIVFHHGSTGNGDNPALFRETYESESVARFFTQRGWMVLFPQRRGRGRSGGLYDEGFTADRSRYSCQAAQALAGLERALEDADVVAGFVLGMSAVDARRLFVGGISRGGILAAAHAERRAAYLGVVNFVGGWLGEGCADAVTVNRATFARAGRQPTPVLWLYGENDPFYAVSHSRANFHAFVAEGGVGAFRVYRRASATANGHFIVNEPGLWSADLDAFLAAAGPRSPDLLLP